MYRYGANNFSFSFYYDKIYKKEYLPSRIRYSQFFFYSFIAYYAYNFRSKVCYPCEIILNV